jgi:hypothetical protein
MTIKENSPNMVYKCDRCGNVYTDECFIVKIADHCWKQPDIINLCANSCYLLYKNLVIDFLKSKNKFLGITEKIE